jgi:hypothetical protein
MDGNRFEFPEEVRPYLKCLRRTSEWTSRTRYVLLTNENHTVFLDMTKQNGNFYFILSFYFKNSEELLDGVDFFINQKETPHDILRKLADFYKSDDIASIGLKYANPFFFKMGDDYDFHSTTTSDV